MGRLFRFLSLFVAFAAPLPLATAAESYSGAFQVSRLAHTTGNVLWNDAATGANGDTVLLWRGGTNGNGVYLQRFDAAGRLLQSQESFIGPTAGIGFVQRAAVAGNGSFAIASQQPDGSGLGVFVTIYDRAGNIIVPQFLVNDSFLGDQRVSSMAMNAGGQFVVTYSSPNSPVTGFDAIYVKRFQPNGAPVAGEILVHSNSSSNDLIWGVDAGIDAAGNFVVTWAHDENFATQGSEVYARRFNSAGTSLGATFRVNTFIDADQQFADIAVSTTGSFVIAWVSEKPTGRIIAARRYNASGTPLGDELQVNNSGGVGSPDVELTPGGGFVVTWETLEVFARPFGPDGVALEPELQVDIPSPDIPLSPRLGVDRDGNFTISWMEYTSSAGSPVRIWARRYAPTGVVTQALANGQVVSPLAGGTNTWRYFRLFVPQGQTTLDVSIFGGVGDADLYIRYGAIPTLGSWDVRPFLVGNNESVRITNIPPGNWYIGVQGFQAYSGLALQAGSF